MENVFKFSRPPRKVLYGMLGVQNSIADTVSDMLDADHGEPEDPVALPCVVDGVPCIDTSVLRGELVCMAMTAWSSLCSGLYQVALEHGTDPAHAMEITLDNLALLDIREAERSIVEMPNTPSKLGGTVYRFDFGTPMP